MKKLLPLLMVMLISSTIISCKKNYSCECTNGAAGLSEEWEGLTTEEAQGAEKACEEISNLARFTTDSCSFKQN